MPSSRTSVECFAKPGRHGFHGSVFLRVSARGVVRFANWEPAFAVELADSMRRLLYNADVRTRGFVTLDVFGDNSALDVDVEQVEPIADELTRAACRASGVFA